jgi:hypothetical protein
LRKRARHGPSAFERIEALFGNEELYALADAVSELSPEVGGRPRDYPAFMYLAFGAFRDVYMSARAAEAELSHPTIWRHIQEVVRARFPDQPDQWLPDKPMRRHHWLYINRRYLADPDLAALHRQIHEEHACAQTLELGLCGVDGGGSLDHPDVRRSLFGDGKVTTPVFKAKRGATKTDKATGEVRPVRADPDAESHVVGSGAQVHGVKFAFVAARGEDHHARMILSYGYVRGGQEAAVAVDCLNRVLPRLPGTQAVIYDGAFHGVHINELIRNHGVIPIVPGTAASGGKHAGTTRVERTKQLGQGMITRSDGRHESCQLWSDGGALRLATMAEDGSVVLIPVKRIKLEQRGKPGAYRLYGVYQIPADEGGGTLRVAHYQTAEDRKRGLNRTEHLRPMPPGDADYERLYKRRPDAESINRGYDDHRYLRRAHSVGRHRQMVDVLLHALFVNSLALARARARHGVSPPTQVAA